MTLLWDVVVDPLSLYWVAVQWLQETWDLLDGTETVRQPHEHRREQLDAQPWVGLQQLDGEGKGQ